MLNHIIEIIKNQWEIKSIKMDWLKMESTLRDILTCYKNSQNTNPEPMSAVEALTLIDECVAAFTKRGNVLKD